jgi:hypothetical protein
MKPIITRTMVVTAGVLIAAAFLGALRMVDPPVDWLTALAGAAVLVCFVYVLGTPEKG